MKMSLLLFSAILISAGCSSTHKTDATTDEMDTVQTVQPADKTNQDVPAIPDSVQKDTSHF